MRNEENIRQYCTRQHAITNLSLNACWNKIQQELSCLLIYFFSVWPPKRRHPFCHRHSNFIINLNLILNFHILSSSLTKMIRTWSQLENLSKEELIEELITADDISSKLSDLSNRFDGFLRRFEFVTSVVTAIAKNCSKLLTEREVQ